MVVRPARISASPRTVLHSAFARESGGRTLESSARSAFSSAGPPALESLLNAANQIPLFPEEAATILVVEDDHAIRLLFTRVLQGAGYEVIACENGALALDVMRAQMEKIHAVITDAWLPVLTGLELIAQIRKLRPEIPAILISGSLEAAADAAAAQPPAVFLCKPIAPSTLKRELQRLLYGRM